MSLCLRDIRDAVENSLLNIISKDFSDIIVVLGNTGSGKSTLINALVYGSQNMKGTYQKMEVDAKFCKGGKKSTRKFVIESKVEDGPKIGHSNSTSETFIPNFYRIDD